MSAIGPPPPEDWYYVTFDSGKVMWVNLFHIVRMHDNGKGGTTLVFADGTVGNILETITPPAE